MMADARRKRILPATSTELDKVIVAIILFAQSMGGEDVNT